MVGVRSMLAGYDVPEPPAIYDHVPQVPYRVKTVPWYDVEKACWRVVRPTWDYVVQACSWTMDYTCWIVLPDIKDVDPVWWGLALRHEFGHCNGWPSSHPGARFVDGE